MNALGGDVPELAVTSAMTADLLTNSAALRSRSEIMSRSSVVPAARGIYGWWFRKVPAGVPCEDCARRGDFMLLYVGIPPKNPTSTQHLRRRILTHYAGNAEGSTLRRTLGVLLAEASRFPLRRVGSGKRMTFTHLGEQWLDAWMEANAFVGWVEHPEPWAVEAGVFSRLSLPLNLQDNQHHAFHAVLSGRRAAAKAGALGEPVAHEHNQRRRAYSLRRPVGTSEGRPSRPHAGASRSWPKRDVLSRCTRAGRAIEPAADHGDGCCLSGAGR